MITKDKKFYSVRLGHLITNETLNIINNVVDEYTTEQTIYCENMKEAIKEAFKNELNHDINFSDIEDDEGNLYYKMLVTFANDIATKEEVSAYKDKTIILYENNIHIGCFELIPQYLDEQ